MGFHNGPVIVTDSLIFNFDAGNDKCTDSDDEVTSMRDIGLVAHSSRTDRGITGAGTTASFSFPTNVGATKTIDLGITGRNSDTDATNYDNRLGLDDNIVFADQSAWSAVPTVPVRHRQPSRRRTWQVSEPAVRILQGACRLQLAEFAWLASIVPGDKHGRRQVPIVSRSRRYRWR